MVDIVVPAHLVADTLFFCDANLSRERNAIFDQGMDKESHIS
jgi:hypothetical protein